MRVCLLVAVCLLSGCYPDLSGYDVRAGDAGPLPPGADAGPPRPGVDAGPPLPRFGGECGRPTLMLAAQSLGDAPSQVLRYELHGTGGIVPCGASPADGELGAEPFSLAAVSDRFVLVASRDRVDAIDPVDDRRLFHLDKPGMHPNDAFAVDDPSRGDRAAVVAWSRTGSSSSLRGAIREIEVYSSEGAVRRTWTSADFMLGNTTAIAGSRRAPGEALAVNSSQFAAAELDLWGVVRRDPPLVGLIADTAIDSLYAGRGRSGQDKLVWTGRVMGEPRIMIMRDPYVTLDDLAVTGLCESELCDPVHAVVDPSLDDAVIAICRRDGVTFEVQRFDLDRGLCETLVPAASLGELRPWYAAILE